MKPDSGKIVNTAQHKEDWFFCRQRKSYHLVVFQIETSRQAKKKKQKKTQNRSQIQIKCGRQIIVEAFISKKKKKAMSPTI